MTYQLARFTYWLLGWQWQTVVPNDLRRYIIIALPHTTNWDFFYALNAFWLMRIPVRFTIKDEFLKPPFGWFLRPLGALGINRRPRAVGEERPSMTQVMAELFQTNDEIALVVTPEGTRSRRNEWKLGFYYTALAANVPIALAYCDYKNKRVGIGRIIQPSQDLDATMREVIDFYRQYEGLGKYPDNFALDKRFS
jgi:1-acyl-sn-glycerol-3-phosphate acyltransferase